MQGKPLYRAGGGYRPYIASRIRSDGRVSQRARWEIIRRRRRRAGPSRLSCSPRVAGGAVKSVAVGRTAPQEKRRPGDPMTCADERSGCSGVPRRAGSTGRGYPTTRELRQPLERYPAENTVISRRGRRTGRGSRAISPLGRTLGSCQACQRSEVEAFLAYGIHAREFIIRKVSRLRLGGPSPASLSVGRLTPNVPQR